MTKFTAETWIPKTRLTKRTKIGSITGDIKTVTEYLKSLDIKISQKYLYTLKIPKTYFFDFIHSKIEGVNYQTRGKLERVTKINFLEISVKRC